MTSSDKPPLVCERIVVGYGGKPLLPAVDLTLERASFWAVVGRNGAGKSTWMRTVLGLLPPVGGKVRRAEGVRLAFVPQRLQLDPIVPVRASDVVAMGAEHGVSFLRPRRKALRQSVARALEEVGADAFADTPFRDLSEGQKQKVLLARCIVGEPDVVFLDEPTAAMDVVAEREILTLIDGLRRRHGTTVVIVAHYLPVVAELAEQVLFLDKDTGAVGAGTPRAVFESEAFRRRYGDMAVGLIQEEASR